MARKKKSRWQALSRFERQGPLHSTKRLTRAFVEGLGQALGFSDSAGFGAIVVVLVMAVAGLAALVVLGVVLTIAWGVLLPVFGLLALRARSSGHHDRAESGTVKAPPRLP